MIAADKYDLTELRDQAWRRFLYTYTYSKQSFVRLVSRAPGFPDHGQELLRLMVACCDDHLPEFFEGASVRAWLEEIAADVKHNLIAKHFAALLKLEDFRETIASDGNSALQHLDRLAGLLEAQEERLDKREKDLARCLCDCCRCRA